MIIRKVKSVRKEERKQLIREFPSFRVVLAVGRVRLPLNRQTDDLSDFIKNALVHNLQRLE